jgi:tetratricopeptide (TPR) repeat protein
MTVARTSIFAFFVLLLAIGAPPPSVAQGESPEQSGRTAFSKEDYEGAVMYFTLAIEEESEQSTRSKAQRADLYFMRGNSFFMMQKSKNAVADFTKAFELMEKKDDDPLNRAARALVLNLRSQSLLDLDLAGSALKDIDYAIELAPQVSAYRRQRALNLYAMDKLTEALADLNVAIGTVSKDSFLYAFRGHIYNELGKTDLAKRDFETASKMDKAGADLVKQFTQAKAKERKNQDEETKSGKK